MSGIYTQALVFLGMAIVPFVLWRDDQTVQVTEELLRQHEVQRSQEMASLLEMGRRSQELPVITQWSMLLSACQYLWFWASAGMLLRRFGFYWLPRQDSSSSEETEEACEETPAEPRRKRRRQRRRKRICCIADYSDKLEQIRSLDQRLEWKDMENSEEEEMKGMINASAKPLPQKLMDRPASMEYVNIHS